MHSRALFFVCLLLTAWPAAGQAPAPAVQDGVASLLGRLEHALKAGGQDAYLQLLSQTADRTRGAQFAAQSLGRGGTRAVVRERDRGELEGTLPGDGYQLLVEVFVENGARARLATWRLDVRRRGDVARGSAEEWGIADQQQLTSLTGLYRLSLNTTRQYAARDLLVNAEDLQLTLETGSVFVAEADGNATAVLLLGKGDMAFTPGPKVERGQVKMFAGAETLSSPFDSALVRMNPFDVEQRVNLKALTQRPVDPKELKRAEEVFRQEIGKSLNLDLGEFSPEIWSLLPNTGDFIAEVRTRRFDTLTYAKAGGEIEDISLFDRRNRHNISLYASKEHQTTYGQFFSEDEQSDYAVLNYNVDVAFNPARRAMDARAQISLVTRARSGTNNLTVRLADSLSVRSVYSNLFGRLLFVRVRNQNSLVLNLPSVVTSGVPMTLTIEYGGPIAPQQIDSEGIWPQQQPQIVDEMSDIPLEETYLYSNRSYWYPQPPITSYSTALIRISVPGDYGCAASGDQVSSTRVEPVRPGAPPTRQFVFSATQPVRYLSFLVTKLRDVRTDKLRLASVIDEASPVRLSGVYYDDVELLTKANARLDGRAKVMAKAGADIVRFYSSVVGDCPYPTITLALVERALPGGHSPPYLSVIAQAAPGSRLNFRDDPASFPDFPEFFVAHEIAHQWWGQAVGWKNYHEQWLSEGFAQYLRRPLRPARARRRGLRQRHAAHAAVDDGRVRGGPDLPGLPNRARQGGRTTVPRRGLQQGRDRPAPAPRARRRQGLLRRHPPLLRTVAFRESRVGRPEAGDGNGVGDAAHPLLRAVGVRTGAPAGRVHLARRGPRRRRPGGGPPLRAGR